MVFDMLEKHENKKMAKIAMVEKKSEMLAWYKSIIFWSSLASKGSATIMV
jgi:hypothetical protein